MVCSWAYSTQHREIGCFETIQRLKLREERSDCCGKRKRRFGCELDWVVKWDWDEGCVKERGNGRYCWRAGVMSNDEG